MERTFRANTDAVKKVNKKKRSEILQAVGHTIFMLMLFMFRGEEQVYSLARDFETSPSTVRSWLTGLLIVVAVFLIFSVVLAVVANKESQRLSRSFITLRDSGVSGVSFAGKEDEGREFFVEYRDIVNATASYSEGTNLIIHARHISYPCLEIECAGEAARMINNKVEAWSSAHNQK